MFSFNYSFKLLVFIYKLLAVLRSTGDDLLHILCVSTLYQYCMTLALFLCLLSCQPVLSALRSGLKHRVRPSQCCLRSVGNPSKGGSPTDYHPSFP